MAWKVRINMMCLLGVLLGLLCLILPCLTRTWNGIGIYPRYWVRSLYLTDYWDIAPWIDQNIFVFAPIAFFVGVALAFVTPLGGIGMALGIVSFYNNTHDWIITYSPGIPGQVNAVNWGAAFYIGILAAIVTLLSTFFPIGPGYSEMYHPSPFRGWRLRERLLVWGRGNETKVRVWALPRKRP